MSTGTKVRTVIALAATLFAAVLVSIGGSPAQAGDGSAIVAAAASQAGLPYCWDGGDQNGPTHGSGGSGCGGSTVGFDCSGLVLYSVYHATGILLSHYTGTQATDSRGALITNEADLQPGDIVFFGGGSMATSVHDGIYAGNGYFWDANDYNVPVQERTMSWEEHGLAFDGARRFWTSSGGGGGGGGTPSISAGNNNGQMTVQLTNFPTGLSYYFCHTGDPSGYPTGDSVPNHGSIQVSSPGQSFSGLCSGSGNFWIGIQATDGNSYYSNEVTLGSAPPTISIGNDNGQMTMQLANFPTGVSYFFCHAGDSSSYPTGGTVTNHAQFTISSPNQGWSSGLCSGSGNFWIGIQATDGNSYYSNQVVLGHAPYGSLDSAGAPVPNSVHVAGWAVDGDTPTSPVTIHVYVGDEGHVLGSANGYRPDVGAAYPGVGDYHGFDGQVPTSKTGAQNVCVYAIDTQGGNNTLLGCSTVTVVADTTPPAVTAQSPASGATGVPVGTSVVATFSEPVTNVDASQFVIEPSGGSSPLPATVTYDAGTNTATLVPAAALAPNTTYSVGFWGGTIQDAAGNPLPPSFWTFTTAPAASPRSEDSAAKYDGWSLFSDPSANGGTWRTSTTTGNSASFSFTAPSVTWVTHKGPKQGIAKVTIDGVAKGSVDLYSTTGQPFSITFSGLAATKHTLVVKVAGTKNAASTGTGVIVDAFIVGTATTQESDKGITYESWKVGSSANASGGSYRSSATAGATATFTFTGTGVDWITATGPGWGKAEVYVDAVDKGAVDLYASAAHWQTAKTFGGLTSGVHTLQIKVLGQKNAAATKANVAVDAFVVH